MANLRCMAAVFCLKKKFFPMPGVRVCVCLWVCVCVCMFYAPEKPPALTSH